MERIRNEVGMKLRFNYNWSSHLSTQTIPSDKSELQIETFLLITQPILNNIRK